MFYTYNTRFGLQFRPTPYHLPADALTLVYTRGPRWLWWSFSSLNPGEGDRSEPSPRFLTGSHEALLKQPAAHKPVVGSISSLFLIILPLTSYLETWRVPT